MRATAHELSVSKCWLRFCSSQWIGRIYEVTDHPRHATGIRSVSSKPVIPEIGSRVCERLPISGPRTQFAIARGTIFLLPQSRILANFPRGPNRPFPLWAKRKTPPVSANCCAGARTKQRVVLWPNSTLTSHLSAHFAIRFSPLDRLTFVVLLL